MAAFAQGIALGALVQGIPVANRAYAGGWWDWLTPFSLLTGVALVIGYALLGATWLIWKTEGQVQDRAYAASPAGSAPATLAADRHRQPVDAIPRARSIVERWFAWPQIAARVVPVPLRCSACGFVLLTGADARGAKLAPFLAALGLFVLCFIGLGISFYPLHRAAIRSPSGTPPRPTTASASCWSAPSVLVPDDPGLYRLFLLGVPRQGEFASGGYH